MSRASTLRVELDPWKPGKGRLTAQVNGSPLGFERLSKARAYALKNGYADIRVVCVYDNATTRGKKPVAKKEDVTVAKAKKTAKKKATKGKEPKLAKAEEKRWQEYLAMMEVGGMKPRSKEAWIANVRAVAASRGE